MKRQPSSIPIKLKNKRTTGTPDTESAQKEKKNTDLLLMIIKIHASIKLTLIVSELLPIICPETDEHTDQCLLLKENPILSPQILLNKIFCSFQMKEWVCETCSWYVKWWIYQHRGLAGSTHLNLSRLLQHLICGCLIVIIMRTNKYTLGTHGLLLNERLATPF